MRILVLGGTGTIGAPVVRELIRSGHEVVALARSAESVGKLARMGAVALAGDISEPQTWLDSLPPLDGVVQAAAAWDKDEAPRERRLLDCLLPYLSLQGRDTRFLYTGGCWLFGSNDGLVATEDTPFDPPPACAYAVAHIQLVQATPDIHPMVIHPAMVFEAAGGTFAGFHDDATTRDAVRVVAGEAVRWALVHREDLAVLYRLALERAPRGESYIGASIEGVPVGRIARAFARRFRTPQSDPQIVSVEQIVSELGDWARGYALDQLQSGAKARRELGWNPRHLDPESEIAAIA